MNFFGQVDYFSVHLQPAIMASGDHEQPCSSRLKMSDEERAKLADKLDRELDDFIDALSKNRVS